MLIMSLDEARETANIHRISGSLKSHQALVARRPFDAPHHTIQPRHIAESIQYRTLDRQLWV